MKLATLLDVFPGIADIQRAKCIMDSLVTELSESLDMGEEEREGLLAVQNVLDILQSPLFAAVVDIRDQCTKVTRSISVNLASSFSTLSCDN